MNRITIQLKDGKKTVEKIEISSGSDLVNLYNALKGGIIFNREMPIPRPDERTHDTDGDLEAQSLGVSDPSINISCINNTSIVTDEKISDVEALRNIDTVSENMKATVEALGEVYKSQASAHASREPKDVIEAFFIMKCPKCGKMKCFNSNSDTLFHCECGETYETSTYIPIYGKCPNCGNNIGTLEHSDKIVATLKDMNISDGMHCRKCKSPIDFTYNGAKRKWETL